MAQDPRVCGGESLVPRESTGGAQKKGEEGGAVAGGEGHPSPGRRAAAWSPHPCGRRPWAVVVYTPPLAVRRLPLPARSWASGPPREGREDARGSPVAWRQPALLRAARRDAAARAGVPRPCPARVVASTVRGPVAGEAPSLTAPLGSHRPGRGRGSDTPVQEQVPGRSLSASRPRVRRSVACHPRPARRRTPRRLLLPVPWKTGLRARWPSPCSGVACTDSGRLPALGRVAPVGAGASQTAQAPSGQAELSARRVRPDLILAGPRAPRGLRVH